MNDAKEIVQSCNVEINEDDVISTFVATSPKQMNDHVRVSLRVFALDCEMVQTAKGSELERITLLQLTGFEYGVQDEVSCSVTMDEFIKPYSKILDQSRCLASRRRTGINDALFQVSCRNQFLVQPIGGFRNFSGHFRQQQRADRDHFRLAGYAVHESRFIGNQIDDAHGRCI